jgi:ADP-heptose:LPS heptosyltransferase
MKIIISPYSQTLRNGKRNPKNYPYWKDLVAKLQDDHIDVIQIGRSGEEQIEGVKEFLTDLNMKELKELILSSDLFFSVDNFFPHMAHYYNLKGVVLWGRSDPRIFGYTDNLNLYKDEKYFREDQFGIWESCDYVKEAFVTPEFVMQHLEMVTV